MSITIRNITFAYYKAPVLNDINAVIPYGDFVALVGPNGSGKSTLIKCINRILPLKKGDVLLDGVDIRSFSLSELAKKIAYVPQAEQKLAPMTVFDTVLMGRKPYLTWYPSREDIEITAAMLKRLDLEDYAMRQVHALSGGQQQRVFIARALCQQPDILLMDEPAANLDLRYQAEILELLRELSGQGLTIIIAMHDINMAAMFAHRIMMLKEGAVFAYGGQEIVNEKKVSQLFDFRVEVAHHNGRSIIMPDFREKSDYCPDASPTKHPSDENQIKSTNDVNHERKPE